MTLQKNLCHPLRMGHEEIPLQGDELNRAGKEILGANKNDVFRILYST